MTRALGLALAAVVLGAGSGHTVRASRPGPVAEVRAYMSALNRHDPTAICATFAPALRYYEGHSDSAAIHPVSCRAAVAGHFRYYSDERWQSARIVRVRSVSTDRRGIAAVSLTLDHDYVCVPPHFSPTGPCRAQTMRLADRIYLTRVGAAWRVVKPGFVFRATEVAPHDDTPDQYAYPPGDARTVTQPVRGVGASFHCPPTRATVSGYDRLDAFPPVVAPWLQIERLSVSELSGGRACYALQLAAAPAPDSAYSIAFGSVEQSAPEDVYEVDFDGLGFPHVLLRGAGRFGDPAITRYLARIALHGTELDVLIPRWAHLRGRFLAAAGTESLQFYEPLLKQALVVSDEGVPYGACLVVPNGRLDRVGNCGATPGP